MITSRLSRRHIGKCAAVISLLTGLGSGALAQVSWDPKYVNPANNPDVVLMPIPCGGSIALQKIVTVTEDLSSPIGPLSDQRVVLGRSAGRTRGYIEESHEEYISGTFNDDNTHERFYLIGAYEITTGQYEAVMAGDEGCPQRMSRKANEAMTNVSWYDAVDFSRKLNNWLYSRPDERLSLLAEFGAVNGFVRLPTEIEWEYAARGGSRVTPAERNEPLFFSEGTIDDYAWYNAATSSGGKIKLVGKKKPNPAGLYDIYGNAEEIVLEPFRMTRADRLHGGIGGFVVRGGSFLDMPALLTSARRDEHPLFDADLQGEFKTRKMGFRILLGAAVIPRDINYVDRLETAYEETQRQTDAPAEEEQPLNQMAELANQVENRELRGKISALQDELQKEFARRNELKARNIRVSMLNGGLQAMDVYLTARSIARLKDGYREAKKTNTGMDFYPPRIRAEFNHFGMIANAYFETIDTLADYGASDLAIQSEVVKATLQQRNDTDMLRFVDYLQTSINKFRTSRTQRDLLHFLDAIPDGSIE